MQFDWSTLGAIPPTTLVRARVLAHHAAQWPGKAARANLDAAPDDSHASLEWDAAQAVMFSRPLAANSGDIRIGLHVAGFELIVVRGGMELDRYPLAGRKEGMTGVWLDSALRALGLKPASDVALPYSLPHHAAARGAPAGRGGETETLAELARWFDAAADLLEEVRAKFAGAQAHAGPVRCWPHHFDIATLISLDEGRAETARSVGVGLSPGDEHYPQPYVYVSPWPRPAATGLPPLPPPGHWHTHGFVGAVVTGEEILALPDRGTGVLAFIEAAYATGGIAQGA